MGKSGLQREMDKFFKELSNADFNIREITKSAFTKSRKKLKPEAFLELNDFVNNEFYEDAPYLGYNNHQLTTINDPWDYKSFPGALEPCFAVNKLL